ncbi:hypothetical protein FB479_107191 [Brevibacillus sp. AG162]|uniref:hypothetical protein n=1 Tax=Brevibacillus sp. AG162 TaxID=2572910 RepID=UPI001153EF0D|nr:hypothetical protein [Brevibacillus sp. AG162]TQK54200.1 hypothetical protein FB479_107191 [Brevibacillus sp. AG162]
MWTPYEERLNHPADFRVKYTFFPEDAGGRKPPFQGYRSDFSYEGDDIKVTGIYAIHPEFEDEYGNVVLDNTKSVSRVGTARMWIVFPHMRELVHSNRIKIGVTGYFMEGSRKVASAEVIEVIGLHSNPTSLTLE